MKTHKRLLAGLVLLLLAGVGFGVTRGTHNADPDLRLVLNIPANRIDVFEGGKRTHSYAVSVGRRGHETPVGSYGISQIIWNPWWHPPSSKWARGRKPTPPGPYNPMGRVKINFANLLYIHGTVEENRLGAPASHGCVRMANSDMFELARLIHGYRTPNVDADLLSMLKANPRMTRSFRVRPVPFQVVYRLVEVVDGKLLIHPDVYREEASKSLHDDIVAELEKQGIEITNRVQQRVSTISKKRNATHLVVELDELLAGTSGGS